MSADFLIHIPVSQAGAGATVLAAAAVGKRHKIVGAVLTIDSTGTVKFSDGTGDLTGTMAITGTGGFVLPTNNLPYSQAATNSALSITTTGGGVKGVVTIRTEP